MDAINKGWFSELGSLWPGQSFSLEVEEVLHKSKSDFQDVLVFKSKNYGNVLVLDGAIQVTERDEFSYHEMITHIPLFAHPNPKDILIVGGGDGGCIREALKHKSVETITLCEIDKAVIDVSKQYLPNVSCGYSHPKVTTIVGDGLAHVNQSESRYDVIIVDSSDPVGPAESLFGPQFVIGLKRALRSGGVVATQCESMWLHAKIIAQCLAAATEAGFNQARYAWASVPTYPCGTIGFMILAKDTSDDVAVPRRANDIEGLQYYSDHAHSAAFVLPRFVEKQIYPQQQQ